MSKGKLVGHFIYIFVAGLIIGSVITSWDNYKSLTIEQCEKLMLD